MLDGLERQCDAYHAPEGDARVPLDDGLLRKEKRSGTDVNATVLEHVTRPT